MYTPYKNSLTTMNEVAVKLKQHEVNAPEHKHWGIFTCDECKEQFFVAHHRIYPSDHSEAQTVEWLAKVLEDDHKAGRKHLNSYESQ